MEFACCERLCILLNTRPPSGNARTAISRTPTSKCLFLVRIANYVLIRHKTQQRQPESREKAPPFSCPKQGPERSGESRLRLFLFSVSTLQLVSACYPLCWEVDKPMHSWDPSRKGTSACEGNFDALCLRRSPSSAVPKHADPRKAVSQVFWRMIILCSPMPVHLGLIFQDDVLSNK